MPDYDVEADRYDETRGGLPRARAVAAALHRIVPQGVTLLDLAVGTGLVAQQLGVFGRRVVGIDLSAGMLRQAADRLPGGIARADATALPVRSGSVGAVSAIWLLHLLADAEPVLAEAARVLRVGGMFVCTVDKKDSMLVASGLPADWGRATDRASLIVLLAERHALHLSRAGSFVGYGQGRSPGADPIYPLLAFSRSA